eukprot:TRINITY_DN3632_c0_g1_i3.p1 TRINITY_DN3632_c0_g1~~TRINITY_DN3632_c0_g1_i3.p1  ORF type:complete len:209 (-),score=37.14 TRINITY_DN3632_c0_g1_i3:33-659(-)
MSDSDQGKVVHLTSKLGFFPLTWDFEMILMDHSSQYLKDHFIIPLFSLQHVLSVQISDLQRIIEDKDIEIEHYRATGVKIPNSKITQKYHPNNNIKYHTHLRNTIPTTSLTELSSEYYQTIQHIKERVAQHRQLTETSVSNENTEPTPSSFELVYETGQPVDNLIGEQRKEMLTEITEMEVRRNINNKLKRKQNSQLSGSKRKKKRFI